jgi:hypothetical protein
MFESFLAKSGFRLGDGVISGVMGTMVGTGGAGLIACPRRVSKLSWYGERSQVP